MVKFCNAKYFGACGKCTTRIIPGDLIAVGFRPARGTSGRTMGQDAPARGLLKFSDSSGKNPGIEKRNPIRRVRVVYCRACGKREAAREMDSHEARRAAYASMKRDGGEDGSAE